MMRETRLLTRVVYAESGLGTPHHRVRSITKRRKVAHGGALRI